MQAAPTFGSITSTITQKAGLQQDQADKEECEEEQLEQRKGNIVQNTIYKAPKQVMQSAPTFGMASGLGQGRLQDEEEECVEEKPVIQQIIKKPII
jgi:hypothetical protein